MQSNMIVGWLLIAFFFFGGIAFVAIDETRDIYIGQIWIAVSLFLALVFIMIGRGEGSGKLIDLSRWRGGTGSASAGARQSADAATVQAAPAAGANTAAKELERLDRLHQKGDVTDAEYQAQRDRILSEAS